jgi:hypothetical protein
MRIFYHNRCKSTKIICIFAAELDFFV